MERNWKKTSEEVPQHSEAVIVKTESGNVEIAEWFDNHNGWHVWNRFDATDADVVHKDAFVKWLEVPDDNTI